MHGTADAIVPFKLGKELATFIPNASLVALDGVGHVPTLTRPEQVSDEIEKLRTNK